MGLTYTSLQLKNPRTQTKISSEALVDTGALHLCIPKHIALQLGLEELEKREVTTADGKLHACPYVGPIEDMDLIVIPSERKIIANPKNPYIPASIAK